MVHSRASMIYSSPQVAVYGQFTLSTGSLSARPSIDMIYCTIERSVIIDRTAAAPAGAYNHSHL